MYAVHMTTRMPPYYGRPIDTPTGHRWAGYIAPQADTCQWAHGPVAELDSRGLCPVCAADEDEDGA